MQYASSEDYAKYCPGGTVPPEEQDAALDAASRDIDGLTFDRIVAVGFDRLTAFQQELVKRAVCEQAKFRSVYAELLASPFPLTASTAWPCSLTVRASWSAAA